MEMEILNANKKAMLLDNFREIGNEMSSFVEKNQMMEDCTEDVIVGAKDITFLSLCEIDSMQKEGQLAFYRLNGEDVNVFLNGGGLKVAYIPRAKFGSEDIIKELARTSKLAMVIENKLYIVSDIAIRTFTLRAEVKGDMTMQRSNIIRNLHIADAIFDKCEKIHMVYRTEKVGGVTVRKIFAGLGGAYRLVPQTILTKSINMLNDEGTLGKIDMSFYEIDHEFTTCMVSLPDIAKALCDELKIDRAIMPGLYVSTSDTGASSVIIRGVYKRGTSYVITDEVTMKHAGDIDEKKMLERASKDIFVNLRKLPETLAELMSREVLDYTKLDLSTEADAEKNLKAVTKIIESELKYVCKEAKVSGKKRDKLLECMVDEINSSVCYTFYDIAVDFMGIAERLEGLDNDTLTRLRKACGLVPYRLEKRGELKAVAAKEDEPVLALLPA